MKNSFHFLLFRAVVLTYLLSYAMGFSKGRAETPPFDGQPWNISTGNLSVSYIQASPIGAFPRQGAVEPPPSVESLVHLKSLGLVANEDYIAWGAVEREPGQWDWSQHDAMEQSLHEAGLKYVVYNWNHFPPVWLREQPEQRTLMKCLAHGEETNYLSIFDPHTIEWYDHFYKNLHEHFGDRIDGVYACISGPYGEGNYPISAPAYINMGHCHDGYWCGDDHAIRAFQSAMERKYGFVDKLNAAWGTGVTSFAEVQPPRELSDAEFNPSLQEFPTPQHRRRWLDFITWYHQAIIDFAEQSLKTVLKYFPADKVRMKPGGNYGSVNPLAWGTYCPGYAKMAQGYGVVLQPADAQGAVFGDKWMGAAYQFYGVQYGTEPASNLNDQAFVQRMFCDASCGVSELFTYEFERHAPDIQKYIQLYTGKAAETEIAVYCPTTLYRLGVNLYPTILASSQLRDLCDYDVLDELLITDGALTPDRYRVLIVFQGDIIDQPVLDKLAAFQSAGGKILVAGETPIKNVEGDAWPVAGRCTRIAPAANQERWLKELSGELAECKGFEGQLDGLWTSRRDGQVFVLNTSENSIETQIDGDAVQIAPHSIFSQGPRE